MGLGEMGLGEMGGHRKELRGKLLGSDREGLEIWLGLGIRIADLNQIADLKLSFLAPVKFRSPI